MPAKIENLTNHIGILIDASSSMEKRKSELIRVADAQIRHLAERSKEHGQETRVSVYSFATEVECLVWDMDVLRLPSIAKLYNVYGWTALRDAVGMALSDHREIPQRHGDHAFLYYVLTDGKENKSRRVTTGDLNRLLTNLKNNETVAVLVPDQTGVFEAKRFGFPANNIALWNPDDDGGVSEAMDNISTSTDNWMTARSRGVRATKDLFNMTSDALNRETVKAAHLKPLASDSYMMIPVLPKYHRVEIPAFLSDNGLRFQLGKAYYQLAKREEVHPHKQVAVLEHSTGKVYTGPQARKLVKLPDFKTRVGPQDNPEYTVFIQSTAPNRKLDAYTKDVKNTRLLLMK